jgi:hypothetical protein
VKLNKKAFALACGIIWGLAIFVITLWVLWRGGGNTLILLEQFYFGYSISYLGAVIGLIYGFVDGFIGGWIFAWLYNIFVKTPEE